MSTTSVGALPATNGFEGLKPPRVELSVISRCIIGGWEVSSPPSRPCSQLHSWITLVTWRCDCGTCVHANSGSGGFLSAGPQKTHIKPPTPQAGKKGGRVFC